MTLPPMVTSAHKGSSMTSDPFTSAMPGNLDRWLLARNTDLISVRRHIHMHPELSHHEFETAAYVAKLLATAGLDPKLVQRGNGVTCDIGEGDRVVALRADMDALPMMDVKNVPYRSTVD